MSKLWEGLTSGNLGKAVNDFNASIKIDKVMYREDIEGSIAHATMLGKTGIIGADESLIIVAELKKILSDIESGALIISDEAEDIHSFIETELTARIGDTGKKLHTGRSRNDQVATDLRLYVRKKGRFILSLILELIKAITNVAENNIDAVMPGYTHLQRAQPVTLAEHLMAYAYMLTRDYGRVYDSLKRGNVSPLGSAALAGTGFPIDREMTAELLGFDGYCGNSMDGVSDRDFCVEFLSACALIMTHLSRLSEEIVLWSSREFGFISLDSGYSTGSSIMPQKKNPDIAELIRGKSGRCYGNLFSLLTVMKGLPLAYNKDMQEDKEAVFDSTETVIAAITLAASMVETMTVNKDKMLSACADGFINATDCADYLVAKGLPFRTAYGITGKIVKRAIELNTTLELLPLNEYTALSDCFSKDVYEFIDMRACLNRRTSAGGPGTAAIKVQLDEIKKFYAEKALF